MIQLELPHCPYCGEKLKFLTAWINKTNGEFLCECCNKKSNVTFDRKIKKIALICVVVSFLIFISIMFLKNVYSIYGSILVLLPFIFFYIYVPFLMELRIIKTNRSQVRK